MTPKALNAALKRHAGMAPEAREKIAKANEEFNDWWGRCRKCGETIEGTPAQIRGHVCGSSS